MLKGRLMQTVRAEAQAARRSSPFKAVIPFWIWVGAAALLLFSVYSTWNTQRLQQEIQSTDM
jgi:hypothetical protein